ncbi:MAG: lipopolysaccharide kinase InaA family protein [Chryseolinea sp.]
MKTKIVLDPNFEQLRPYVEALHRNFDRVGMLLEDRRNVIREDHVLGTHLVIKSFKRIYFANKIRYSFFAASKAQRGYDNANILIDNGFETPRPIAYVEVSRFGIINHSYFVSEYTSLKSLRGATEEISTPSKKLMLDLAAFTFSLHQKGIYHVDYNLGNILVNQKSHKTDFALIDTNRMDFGPVSFKKGIKNMVKLGLPTEQLTWMAEEYARLRKMDESLSVSTFFQFKRNELLKRQMKRSIKQFLGVIKSLSSITVFASEEFSNGLVIAIDAMAI